MRPGAHPGKALDALLTGGLGDVVDMLAIEPATRPSASEVADELAAILVQSGGGLDSGGAVGVIWRLQAE